jgi:hypothetical protein
MMQSDWPFASAQRLSCSHPPFPRSDTFTANPHSPATAQAASDPMQSFGLKMAQPKFLSLLFPDKRTELEKFGAKKKAFKNIFSNSAIHKMCVGLEKGKEICQIPGPPNSFTHNI